MNLHFEERKILANATPRPQRKRDVRSLTPVFFLPGLWCSKSIRIEFFRVGPVLLGVLQNIRRDVDVGAGWYVVISEGVVPDGVARKQPDRWIQPHGFIENLMQIFQLGDGLTVHQIGVRHLLSCFFEKLCVDSRVARDQIPRPVEYAGGSFEAGNNQSHYLIQ